MLWIFAQSLNSCFPWNSNGIPCILLEIIPRRSPIFLPFSLEFLGNKWEFPWKWKPKWLRLQANASHRNPMEFWLSTGNPAESAGTSIVATFTHWQMLGQCAAVPQTCMYCIQCPSHPGFLCTMQMTLIWHKTNCNRWSCVVRSHCFWGNHNHEDTDDFAWDEDMEADVVDGW